MHRRLKRYVRNPDKELRRLERQYLESGDVSILKRIQQMQRRAGQGPQCSHRRTRCVEHYYGNYEDSGTVWSLVCDDCEATLRSETLTSWDDYYGQAPDWCLDDYDSGYARNPLKKNAFESKIKKLKLLGVEQHILNEIKDDFNGSYNDPTHAIYILDWWLARKSMQKFLDTEKDEYVINISRYCNKYKVDPHDLTFDDVLQIDHYNTLRHYAQLASTNPYFRMPWPHLHLLQVQVGNRYNYQTGKEVHIYEWTVGEIREWNSATPDGRPAIKLVTGRDRAVSQSIQSRIDREKIVDVVEKSDPATLIAFLHDCEQNVRTTRYFEPAHNDVLMEFPDGKQWVVIRPEDTRAEGQSLNDCAKAENNNTILISLREPITETHVQALLKAEIVFPERIDSESEVDKITHSRGIIVQLRGYANSKPTPEMHQYIVPLLYADWVYFLVTPDYSSYNTFILKDLDPEILLQLKRVKPYLFNAQTLNDNYGVGGYPAAIVEKITEQIVFPTNQLLQILQARRQNKTLRKKALQQLQRRLENGTKYKRTQLLQAVQDLLLRTRDKDLISAIFDLAKGFKSQSSLFTDFLALRRDWLVQKQNHRFFAGLLERALPRAGTYYARRALPSTIARILQQAAPDQPAALLKILFKVRFDSASARNVQKLAEAVLQVYVDDPGKLNDEICRWYMQEAIGWGSSQHRSFPNEIPLSQALKRQLRQLIEYSVRTGNECHMDLAVTIISTMSDEDKAQMQTLVAYLAKQIVLQQGYRRSGVYKQLGRLIV